MKNLYLIFLLTFTVSSAQIVNIPDANFKNALVNENVADLNGNGSIDGDVDTNNDGEIQVSEAETVFGLFVPNYEIASLEGIESFIQIRKLDCSLNNLTELNVTQNIDLRNLECRNNILTTLNLSQNHELETLQCNWNELTSLDVTQNPFLSELSCEFNNLTSLNVGNINLQLLYCRENYLTELNVSQLQNLNVLNCGYNLLSNLDVTNNQNLSYLYCNSNQLTNLDVSQNLELLVLWCDDNYQFSQIDVSLNIILLSLSCGRNQITSLNLTQNSNLYSLHTNDNLLNSLNLSQNQNLKSLNCSFNQIYHLDLSSNSSLENLSCTDNLLNTLNVQNGNNINMDYFYSFNNPDLLCINVDDVIYANNQVCDIPNYDGWCKDETAQYEEDCELCIMNNEINNIIIFPNPVNNLLNITAIETINSIVISNVLGQEIYNAKMDALETTIDMSGYIKGTYFVKISVAENTIIKKIIKE